jgi:hypothetical protein
VALDFCSCGSEDANEFSLGSLRRTDRAKRYQSQDIVYLLGAKHGRYRRYRLQEGCYFNTVELGELSCICIMSGEVCDEVEAFSFTGATGTALPTCAATLL